MKTLVLEARAIASALPAGLSRDLSKKDARPLRRRCLEWLDCAPVSSALPFLAAWGAVVCALVCAEDALRRGVASIKTAHAPAELARWLDTIARLDTQKLFATRQGRYILYPSVCKVAAALRQTPSYSMTLYDALVTHCWNPLPLLRLLACSGAAYRGFQQHMRASPRDWPEDIWLQAFLMVARASSWRIPNQSVFHACWAELPMFMVAQRPGGRPLQWDGNQNTMEMLLVKLTQCLPLSAAQALKFAQDHTDLVSPTACTAIMDMDLHRTMPAAGVFAWLRMHTQETPAKMPLRQALALKYPGMESAIHTYLQVTPQGEETAQALNLLPAWNQWVCGCPPQIADAIDCTLFSD